MSRRARAPRGRRSRHSSLVRIRYLAALVALVANALPGLWPGVGITGVLAAAAPAVTSLSPASGPLAGSSFVIVDGSGLTDVTSVSFGTVAAPLFYALSDSEIYAVSPPAALPGPVDVTVTSPEGASALSSGDVFTYTLAAPTVGHVSPASGPAAGGATVTITGTYFLTGATTVTVGGVVAQAGPAVQAGASSVITATIPVTTGLGPADVQVTTPSGPSATSPADVYTYIAALPTITGVSPASGATSGGSTVTISGANLLNGATAVAFGGQAATAVGPVTIVGSHTVMTAASPLTNTTGAVDLRLTTPGGVSAVSATDKFTYTAPVPAIAAISPLTGSTAGGTTVTITGTGLLDGGTSVLFGGAPAASVGHVNMVGANTVITATSPVTTGSGGPVDVVVSTAGGLSAITPGDVFTYTLITPTVSAVSPGSGVAAGGTTLTITGTDFVNGVSTVEVGGQTAPTSGPVTFKGGLTVITATTPVTYGTGAVDVQVTTPATTSATGAADEFTYTAGVPSITSITPVTGTTAGGTTVTITGKGFISSGGVGGSVAHAAPAESPRALIKGAVTMAQQVPHVVSSEQARLLHPHAAQQMLTVNLGLPLRNQDQLATFIATEASRGVYMSQADFAANYAPTPQQVSAVTAWASSQGLTPAYVSPDGLTILVKGTTQAVATALGVQIDDYLGPSGQAFYSSNREATLPAALGVQSISGLSDIHTFRSFVSRPALAGAPLPRLAAANGISTFMRSGGYFPSDLRTAYDLAGHGYDGTGQTIGLTLWGAGISDSDLAAFAAHTGDVALSSGTGADQVEWIPVNGGSSDNSTSDEVAMDVEYAHGMATHSHLKYWLADCSAGGCFPSDAGLEAAISAAANDTSLHMVSNSWGGGEAASLNDPFVVQTTNSFMHAVAVGTTFYFSSGDSGSDSGGSGLPSYPADNPYVVAVGGTTLNTTSGFGYSSESAWGGSGGGCSAVFARPSWQVGVANASCSGRAEPDIAADADPNTGAYVYYLGGAQQIGGTSLSAPLVTGMAAVTDQYLEQHNSSDMGWAAPTIYTLANGTGYSSDFHDVTSGNNGFPARPGWDQATGWGSQDWYRYTQAWLPQAPSTGSISVTFGGVPAQSVGHITIIGSSTVVTATSPVTVNTGGVDVRVVTSGGSSAIGSVDKFTYTLGTPAITALSPVTGSTAGGATVTITGSGFINGATRVSFGSVPAFAVGKVQVANGYSVITATSPVTTGLGGPVDVTVAITGGGNSPAAAADVYTYTLVQPTIGGLSPSSGSVNGGTTLTITGTNFVNGHTFIMFGSVASLKLGAVRFVGSNTVMTATSPVALSSGTVDIQAVTAGGTSPAVAQDRFTYTGQIGFARSRAQASRPHRTGVYSGPARVSAAQSAPHVQARPPRAARVYPQANHAPARAAGQKHVARLAAVRVARPHRKARLKPAGQRAHTHVRAKRAARHGHASRHRMK